MFDRLWDHFARAEHWRVYEDVGPTFAELQNRGIVIALGSNFDSRIADVVAGHPTLALIDHCFWSTQLRASKPDLDFFHRIADQLSLDGAQLLMIGDDRVNDLEGARSAGWQALQRNDYTAAKQYFDAAIRHAPAEDQRLARSLVGLAVQRTSLDAHHHLAPTQLLSPRQPAPGPWQKRVCG